MKTKTQIANRIKSYIGRPFRLVGHGMQFVCYDAYEFLPGKIAVVGHNEDSTKKTTARVLDILWLDTATQAVL